MVRWLAKNRLQEKANVDLWQRFLKIRDKHQVKFNWVKGHATNVENNRCDELAVAAYKTRVLLIDEGYEASKDSIPLD